jgi:hypothetical protein
MPHSRPVPSPRLVLLRRFRRIMKGTALLAIAVAALAVVLAARGSSGGYIPMLVAAALGAGLAVLLAGALMSLLVLGSSRGQDEQAAPFQEEDRP